MTVAPGNVAAQQPSPFVRNRVVLARTFAAAQPPRILVLRT